MTVYIILLIVLFITYCIDHSVSNTSVLSARSNRCLRFTFIVIYLVCALRASSVGRDISGYARIYELTKSIPWGNYDYVYFENGYIFLMKICIALGLDFQGFMAVCYAMILLPLYFFIKRFSDDKILSVICFVCYMYFEFTLTALRQALSMSIVLIAFMILARNKKRKILYCFILFYIASLFHKGAYICYIALLFYMIKDIVIYTFCVVIGSMISLFARNYLFVTIKTIFEKDSFNLNSGLYIGLNLIVLIVLSVVFLYVNIYAKNRNSGLVQGETDKKWLILNNADAEDLFLKLFLLSIMVLIFFGYETSARSYMYFNQVIFILLPNSFRKISGNKPLAVGMILIILLVAFFVENTLLSNSFDIVPYSFYWQT